MIGGVKKRQEARGLGPVYREVGTPETHLGGVTRLSEI